MLWFLNWQRLTLRLFLLSLIFFSLRNNEVFLFYFFCKFLFQTSKGYSVVLFFQDLLNPSIFTLFKTFQDLLVNIILASSEIPIIPWSGYTLFSETFPVPLHYPWNMSTKTTVSVHQGFLTRVRQLFYFAVFLSRLTNYTNEHRKSLQKSLNSSYRSSC